MGKLPKRPAIPDQVQRELWGRAAGRCQFHGCNKLLYKDDLTQQRANLGRIAHIVAYSPDGPRGHPTRSKELETAISNLMLLCTTHGDLIDKKELEDHYPEDLLLQYKQEHEYRVRVATAMHEDAAVHILLLQAPINGRDIVIDSKEANAAIAPRYPAEEHPFVIDLSTLKLPAEGTAFFSMMAQSIRQQLDAILLRRAGQRPIHRLAVFALAPIPLLMYTGFCLGDIATIELYQRHRDTQNWRWKEEEAVEAFYESIKPTGDVQDERPIALIFSISGEVSIDHVAASLRQVPHIYEIRARVIGRDFLRSRKRLELFGYEVRTMLVALGKALQRRQAIHVFAAVPAPMAIEFGRSIRTLDTPFILYEYQDSDHAYVPVLTLCAE
jgi:hypothetical protein